MKILTSDDWKTEVKWEEYKLMIQSMHHVSSQMKGKKEKQITDKTEKKRGAEW